YYGQKSTLSALQFKFYPDVDSTVNALKNRTVQGISYLPHSLKERLLADKDLATYVYHLPQYTALFFNGLNNPDLKSLAVRQALSSMIDRDAIIRDALAGEGERVDGPFLSGFFGEPGSPDKGAPADYNPERAVTLLETAGWKRGEGGLWEKEDKDKKKHTLRVTITTINQEENMRVADLVKEAWMAAGVDVQVSTVDPVRVRTDVIDPRNYEALLYGEIIGSDPDPYPFWHSSQARAPGLNLASFSNSDADKLLEEGRTITSLEKRKELYKKFQTLLAQDAPAAFLYRPMYTIAVSKKLKGVSDGTHIIYPSDRLSESVTWYSKSKRVWKKGN
ncbi:MAG: ABC transporter substrate-binding protein, partial [Patescibacteria group bacterium]